MDEGGHVVLTHFLQFFFDDIKFSSGDAKLVVCIEANVHLIDVRVIFFLGQIDFVKVVEGQNKIDDVQRYEHNEATKSDKGQNSRFFSAAIGAHYDKVVGHSDDCDRSSQSTSLCQNFLIGRKELRWELLNLFSSETVAKSTLSV